MPFTEASFEPSVHQAVSLDTKGDVSYASRVRIDSIGERGFDDKLPADLLEAIAARTMGTNALALSSVLEPVQLASAVSYGPMH